MNEPWLIFILLGLAAAFLPWQIAYEIYLFGEENGLKKATVFAGGITAFRVLLLLVIGPFFVGIAAYLTRTIIVIARFAQSILVLLGHELTSGQREFLDLLLILSGILLLVQAFLYYRGSKAEKSEEEILEEEQKDRSMRSLFLLGLGWTAITLNQWLFTLTGINIILTITRDPLDRVLLSLLFLLLASIFILLPFVIYLIKPQTAHATLERINNFISGSMAYLIIALMIAAGLYLIWIGARGLWNYFY